MKTINDVCHQITEQTAKLRPCSQDDKNNLYRNLLMAFLSYNKPNVTKDELNQCRIEISNIIANWQSQHPQRYFSEDI